MRSLASQAKADPLHLQRQLPPIPHSPCPSNTKSNLRKGRMWLISDYILNEGYCWLVAFIGTLISCYCNPDVGERRGRWWVVEEDWKRKGEEKHWQTGVAVVCLWWVFYFFKPGFPCTWLAAVILVWWLLISTKSHVNSQRLSVQPT